MTLLDITALFSKYSRSELRAEASSEMFSAMMSRAPASAAALSATSFAASTNFCASASQSAEVSRLSIMNTASGSSPRSLAIVAFVLRFGLNG